MFDRQFLGYYILGPFIRGVYISVYIRTSTSQTRYVHLDVIRRKQIIYVNLMVGLAQGFPVESDLRLRITRTLDYDV